MTDDLEPLRRARPDRLLPDDPPDPETLAREKARLMSAITGPEGVVVHRRTPSIYPRLAYRDEVAALDFLTRAFDLVERRESRMEQPGGMLAWLEIGDGVVMIGRAGEERHGLFSPLDVGARTAAVNVYVHDIDAHYHRAESQGAQIVTPLEDMFWGDRRYEALDLEGHRWHFAERLSEIQQLQELAGGAFRFVVPNYGHDLGGVDHGPAGLAHQADHAVLPDLHAGQLPVRPGGESDLATPADDHENGPGLADEGPEQIADHLAGHEASPPDSAKSRIPRAGDCGQTLRSEARGS
jgi:PhnB protein